MGVARSGSIGSPPSHPPDRLLRSRSFSPELEERRRTLRLAAWIRDGSSSGWGIADGAD